MSKNSKAVIDWRNRTKERIIQSFGGCCGICGYKKCQRSIDLHHLDSDEKDFSLGSIRAWPKSWESIVVELRKCVLLCSNCHGEVHDEITFIPNNITRFNEIFSDYKTLERLDRESKNRKSCPVCGKDMFNSSNTCSHNCAARLARKYNWDAYDLHDLYMVKKMSCVAISKIVGCSNTAVNKRLKKLNLIPV